MHKKKHEVAVHSTQLDTGKVNLFRFRVTDRYPIAVSKTTCHVPTTVTHTITLAFSYGSILI